MASLIGIVSQDGLRNSEQQFAVLLAFAEWVLEATWVLTVWQFRVWDSWYPFTEGSVVLTIGRLFAVKCVLVPFNFFFSFLFQVSYSWRLAWIAEIALIDFALAVVVGFFHDRDDAMV